MNSREYASLMTGGILLDPDEEIALMNDFQSDSENRQELYHDYLESESWRKIRAARLNLDNYKCVKCSETKRLQVHHIVYRNWNKTRLSDVMTLCPKCHELEHS